MSLQQFQETLNNKKFVRIHRSFVVNISAIQSFNENEVQLKNIELPISRTYREDFVKQFHP
jgi:DNA-binding LytR/AlgR family response regulator